MDWDARYAAAEGFLFGTEPAAFLLGHADLLRPGLRTLCVADGEGRNSVWLAAQGLRVTAFDSSAVAQQKARAFAAARGVEVAFVHADAAAYDWPEAGFDLVVAVFIQFAGPDLRHAIFAGMKRATVPGGLILLHGYTPAQLEHRTGGPSQVENLYTAPMLRTGFDGCDILELREYAAELAEGSAHVGTSALIDMVARRR